MRRSGKLFFAAGCLLILASLTLLLVTHLQTTQAQAENIHLVETISALLPDPIPGVMENRSDSAMPALEIEGTDYTAIVEIPALGLRLPVSDRWDKQMVFRHPCRFYGSVYDGSLIIGGADRQGQFSGFDRIGIGTAVTITDMTGAVFSYAVDDIERTTSAAAEVLIDANADLTLFVRNTYDTDYILLRCSMR